MADSEWNSAWVLLGDPTKRIPQTLSELAGRIDRAIKQNRHEELLEHSKVIARLRNAMLSLVNRIAVHGREGHSCEICEALSATKRYGGKGD